MSTWLSLKALQKSSTTIATLGIPCLQMAAEPRSELARLIEAEPGEELMVDLEHHVVCSNQSFPFSMKPSARPSCGNL